MNAIRTESAGIPVALHDLSVDNHVRFKMLRAAVAGCFGDRTPHTRPRFLDVGCGPVPFSLWFLGQYGDVVRADTQNFGDADILTIPAGQALPFAERSHDAVIAMDVLEHIPKQHRSTFLAEAFRVADGVAIFAFPHRQPAVVDAEKRLNALFREVFAAPCQFLDEHSNLELPDAFETIEQLRSLGAHVVHAENSLLSEWLGSSLLDFLFLREFGDDANKASMNARIGQEASCYYPGRTHYRSFVFAAKDPALVAPLQEAIRSLRGPLEPPRSFVVPENIYLELTRFVDRAFAHRFVPILAGAEEPTGQLMKRLTRAVAEADLASKRASKAEAAAVSLSVALADVIASKGQIEQQLSESFEQIVELNRELAASGDRHQQGVSRSEALQASLEILQGELAAKQAAYTKLEADRVLLTARLEAAETIAAALGASADDLRSHLERTQNELSASAAHNSEVIGRLEQALAETSEHSDRLNDDLSTLRTKEQHAAELGEELRTRLEAATRELAEARAVRDELESAHRNLAARLEATESIAMTLGTSADDLRRRLEQTQGEQSETEIRAAQLAEQLAAVEANAFREAAEYEARLELARNIEAGLRGDILQTHQRLRAAEDELESNRDRMEQASAKVEAASQEKSAAIEMVNGLERQLAMAKGHVAELMLWKQEASDRAGADHPNQAEHRMHANRVVELERQVSSAMAEAFAARYQIETLTSRIAESDSRAASCDEAVAALHRMISERDLQVYRVQNQFNAIQNSTIWRMTRGLRSLVDRMRRK
jgi:predicted  nucleic acid-binding Zn-ribbon protein